MSTKVDNYAKPIGKRGDLSYYLWRVFISEPPEVLAQIKSVEYLLHPTFPDPVQIRSDPSDRFALETSGWGVFIIAIRVNFKDGRKEDLRYGLDFGKGWPEP